VVSRREQIHLCSGISVEINASKVIMGFKPANVDEILGKTDKHVSEPMYGIMVYDHKTAGTLMMVPKSQFNSVKKMMDRKGQQSILRKVTPNGGRKI
jgi:hypothetical protein